jgi:hypothetical protein
MERTCVPRSVNDVDFGVLVSDGCVLCENCDSALLLQRVGVHNSFIMLLILAENAGLSEQGVNQSGFSVINCTKWTHSSVYAGARLLTWPRLRAQSPSPDSTSTRTVSNNGDIPDVFLSLLFVAILHPFCRAKAVSMLLENCCDSL